MYTDDGYLCSFDFFVQAFQNHILDTLAEGTNDKFKSQVAECAKEIEKFHNGPETQVEQVKTQLEEINTGLAQPNSIETKKQLKDQFYQVINKSPEAANEALQIIAQEVKNPKEDNADERAEIEANMFEALRALFGKNNDEEQVDEASQVRVQTPEIYEEIDQKFQNDEVQIKGVEDKIAEAIKAQVHAKVEEEQTGKKTTADIDPAIFEQVVRLFDDAEKEAKAFEEEQNKKQ